MENTESIIVVTLIAIAIALMCAGCAFHVGFDYNGQTGVHNTTATQMSTDKSAEQKKY